MATYSEKPSSNVTIIVLTMVFAVTFHAAALFTFHGTAINFYSPQLALVENQMHALEELEKDTTQQLQQKERTLQITEAFHALTQDDSQEKIVTEKVEEEPYPIPEFESIAYEEIIQSELENPATDGKLNGNEDSLALVLADTTDAPLLSLNAGTASLLLPDAKQLLFEKDAHLVKEITQATEGMRGEIADEKIMLYTSNPTIQIGSVSATLELANSFHDHSGILEEPADSPSLDIPSGLVGTSAILNADELSLHAGENKFFTFNPEANLKEFFDPSHNGKKGVIACSNDFHVGVEFSKNQKEKGYLFKVTINPKQGTQFRRITQNISFLIDRSHSIPKGRFELTKKAVSAVLPLLSSEDTFNILVFDKNVVTLSSTNLKNTPENIALARNFLEKQEYGGLFATTDLYASLGAIIPQAVAENEVNLAILLSDGDTYLKPSKQRKMIKRWSTANQGKVSLFCVAAGVGNNVPMLDMISTFNKGTVHIAPNDTSLTALLSELMHAIQNPIGKEMAVSSVSINESSAIHLLPVNERLPNLYEHIPYVIYGNTETLNDFYLFLQGRYYDKWVNIKQLITFDNAQVINDNRLEKMWAIQQAYESYDRFLNDGNGRHLHHAKELLEPFKIQTPFY